MGLLIVLAIIAVCLVLYLVLNTTSHKCTTAVIVIDGVNVTLICTKCGKSQTISAKIFEDKFGKSVEEYVEAKGFYVYF